MPQRGLLCSMREAL